MSKKGHWLRELPEQTPETQRICEEYEGCEERIAGLNEQIRAVMEYMSELDAEADALAAGMGKSSLMKKAAKT